MLVHSAVATPPVIEAGSVSRRGQGRTVEGIRSPRPTPWVIGFLALHLGCQLLLLIPGLSAARVLVRTAAFGASLALLAFVPAKRAPRLPVRSLITWILVLLSLEMIHPDSAIIPGIAAVVLNLAILAPTFWVPRTHVTTLTFQRLVVILWLFYTASAMLGVLQSFFPGRFEPQLSSVIAGHGRGQIMSLKIRLASGERIFRPMGLTDTPGGAAYGGLYAILLGTGILLLRRPPFQWARVLAIASMVSGMVCLYLCQVRSLLVMAGICELTLFSLLLITGRVSKLLGLVAALGALVPATFVLAVSLGGRSVTDRLTTLINSDPGSVYYTNRGHFLETTIFEYLPLYPLGAGLGRWGMINSYFGALSSTLWAEIQWTGWVFDGGLPLVLLYFAAVVVALWACLRVARGRVTGEESSLTLWGAVIVAYDVGALALCFNYPVFSGTAGIEFWLLNAALLCAAYNSEPAVFRARAAV